MVVIIVTMGVYPQPFLRRMDRSVASILQGIEKRAVFFTPQAPAKHAEGRR
jgi:NADH:ubiquinone oxidoreductase subunit 4 (subunit M)